LQKHPGSTGINEKQSGKPPLPINAVAELRKGSYYASLELVQALCDTSYGLVDIFPIEDRKIALREVGQTHYHVTTWLFISQPFSHPVPVIALSLVFSHSNLYPAMIFSFMWQSLTEINSQIASAEKNGGDFFSLIQYIS